ncbi:MAG: cadherin-like domain-containing protein [Saprospiraceae bacterium]|nr:cadherin-like domain-containing protein [Saprospiraceae bacterium]
MNVFLHQPHRRALLLTLLLLAAKLVVAQSQGGGGYKNLITAENTIINDTISGQNLTIIEVSPLALHGEVDVILLSSGGSGNPFVYQIRYTPDPGFTGVDTFTLELSYVGSYPFLIYRAYRVSVYESLITAQNDYAVTSAGSSVTIDALANDAGTNAPLTIDAIPLVDHGTATINGNGEVVFTPEPGFLGVAHINYNVCDVLFNCKTAQISVGVNNGSPVSDTLRVTTIKNAPVSIPLTYDGYTVFQAPSNGTVILTGGMVFKYTPNLNHTGTDQFVLANDDFGATFYKTVKLDIINGGALNNMAMDDHAFTPKGTPVTFNVRDNDIGNLTVKSWNTPANFPGTISGTSASGQVTFTPNTNFTGVASFTYVIGNMFVNNLEMATAYVVVGNLPPRFGTFELSTPKETPMVVNYKIPFIGFNFSILDAPDFGSCDFYPGYTTQTINGQSISGHNLLIYTPEAGFTGTDEFEINYCVAANNQCHTVKIVMDVVDVYSTAGPYCVADCVWAGDVNYDGMVDNKDLLPLGYLMGIDGNTRPDASLEWYPQYATNWSNPYTGITTDLKHADTNGDGFVTVDDTLAIGVFYREQHNLVPNIPAAGKGLNFALNLLTPNPAPGDLVQVEVGLGTTTEQVTDLFGFTFDAQLSPQIVDSALHMQFFPSTWINLNAPYLTLSKNPLPGRLESAFTRTGGIGINGHGIIGQFDFIIIDIVDGVKAGEQAYATVTVDAPTLMWSDGSTSTGESVTLNIPINLNDKNDRTTAQDLLLFPSPASDLLQIHLNGKEFIEQFIVYDAMGRMVYDSGNVLWERAEIRVSDMAPGMYVATARTAEGLVSKKFQIMR